MKKSTFYLNMLDSEDNSLSKLKLHVYEIEGPCTYKDLAKVFDRLGLAFDFSKGFIYLTEDSDYVKEALEAAGYKVSQNHKAEFKDIYDSTDRKILYRILYKSFENLLRSKGFELSKKHRRRHQKVALPLANVYKGSKFFSTGKTNKTDYVVKEGLEYFFSIMEDGLVTLRLELRPVITIPSGKVEGRKYDFTPECTCYDCDVFNDCGIHKLGPVGTPKSVDSEPVSICNKNSNFLTMFCHKTKELVAIPIDMLFVEASSQNLRRLDIYSKEYFTLNKKPKPRFELTEQIMNTISEKGRLSLPISKDIIIEFKKDFTKIEVEPWK
jgi:hemerythrin